jgi:hypothetical protein
MPAALMPNHRQQIGHPPTSAAEPLPINITEVVMNRIRRIIVTLAALAIAMLAFAATSPRHLP